MTMAEAQDIADVVQRVQGWPTPMRIALARRILETLETAREPAAAPPVPRGPSAAEVAAMFATDKPAPNDATVKQWIEEHLIEKYGQ
jgi:hypothetical protein